MLALALAAVVFAQQPLPATGLRGTGDFVVVATQDPVEVVLRCVQVSSTYTDSMTAQIFDGTGKTIARETIPPAQEKTLRLPKSAGPYLVSCAAGRNAVEVAARGGAVIIDCRGSRRLALYHDLQPLAFFIQPTDKLTLRIYAEEPAELAILAPDGTQLWHEAIPDHTDRTASLSVKPDWIGPQKLWRLTGKLDGDVRITLDPAIVPFFADGDAAAKVLSAMAEGLPSIDLDGRPASMAVLRTDAPAKLGATLKTGDGLSLSISRDGEILACGTTAKLPTTPRPRGGFVIRDHTAGGKLIFGRGRCQPSRPAKSADVSLSFDDSPYSLRATVTAEAKRMLIRGEVRSSAADDRAITLMCLVPAPKAAKWFDDIDTARKPAPGVSMCQWVRSGAGALGKASAYPLGCIAGGPMLADAGLALAIPLNQPRLFRISYASEPGLLVIAFDFGLTPATKKFLNRASFSFELFRTDAAWGFRDALRRYYAFHPADFTREIPKVGGWVCWGHLKYVPNFRDFGFQYHWGPGGADAVKFDDEHGVYSFLYNDSVRYFADLGEFEKRPTHEQATAVFNKLLTTPDPRSFILSRPREATGRRRYESRERSMGREAAEKWLKDSLEAARRSAVVGPDGTYQIGYIINRKDWGPPNVNWWTGRLFCNPDPDIPGGYGNFLIDRIIKPTFDAAEAAGAHYDGVGLDNYFVYAQMLDCRREHFAYVDNPLSFDRATLKVGAVGDFILCEWVEHLRKWLRADGRWLIANQGHWPYPFAARLLDIHGFEWGIQRAAVIARSLAYHKPVVSLPVREDHYQEPFVRDHVRFGFLPGGYATREFAARKGVRELYRKYIPALLACAEAGWEPVTYVRSSNEAVKVERFGRPGGRLLLTIVNESDQPQRARLAADMRELGLRSKRFSTRDMISGAVMEWRAKGDELACEVSLKPREARVVELSGVQRD